MKWIIAACGGVAAASLVMWLTILGLLSVGAFADESRLPTGPELLFSTFVLFITAAVIVGLPSALVLKWFRLWNRLSALILGLTVGAFGFYFLIPYYQIFLAPTLIGGIVGGLVLAAAITNPRLTEKAA